MPVLYKRLKDIGVYALAVLAVFVTLIFMVGLNFALWTRWGGLGGFAVVTGIPTFGGAPGFIHWINMLLYTWPGYIAAWWILNRLSVREPRFGRTMAGLIWVGLVAWVFGVTLAPWAVRSAVVDYDHMFWSGFMVAFVICYIWTDRFVYRKALHEVG